MIKYIQIENFKSLKRVAFPLENLNLFFGMNGMGKSSVIQSLLLLRQSFWEIHRINLDCLYTNGELIRLGTAKDIICQNAEEDIIRFYLQYSEQKKYDFKYTYKYMDNDSEMDRLYRSNPSEDFLYDEALFTDDFVYLSAEHLGPQKQYSTENWKRDSVTKFGTIGQYVVPFMAVEGETYKVPDALCLPNSKTNRLIDQVSAWMSEISPGIKLSAEMLTAIEKATLSIRYSGKRLDSEPFMPVNVGFGIPYVLPLIVALLTSTKDSLLLIENPESHLHPKGQTMIAELVARVAENGTQIICESHSDHIINGIRVAVKHGKLKKDHLSVSFFSKSESQDTIIQDILVDENGNLSDYPKGLLDEWGILMAELM